MPVGKDGVCLRVGNMDGNTGGERGRWRWNGQGECVEVEVSKSQGKITPSRGAKSGHFALGFEPCQVRALAKTCTDLADIADAKQEAGLRTSSHL